MAKSTHAGDKGSGVDESGFDISALKNGREIFGVLSRTLADLGVPSVGYGRFGGPEKE